MEVLGCYARIHEMLLLKLGYWAAGADGIGMPRRWGRGSRFVSCSKQI